MMIKAGFLIIAIGIAPLLLYWAFGPADGNPIGLGLLFISATPLGALVLAIGLIWTVWKALREPRQP